MIGVAFNEKCRMNKVINGQLRLSKLSYARILPKKKMPIA